MKKKALVISASFLLVGVAAALLAAWTYLSSTSDHLPKVTQPEDVVIAKSTPPVETPAQQPKPVTLGDSAKRVESKLGAAKLQEVKKPAVPAQTGGAKSIAQVPVRSSGKPVAVAPVGPDSGVGEGLQGSLETPTPQEPVAGDVSVTAEKLGVLELGMTYAQVASVIGDSGRRLGDGLPVPFQPIGWATVEWGSRERGGISATFNEQERLVTADIVNVPGTEAIVASPSNAVRNWLNNAMADEQMAVRVPMVIVKASGPRRYEYSGALVSETGVEVGEIAGVYQLGDGVTTFASGDSVAYTRLLEGLYEVTWDNGTKTGDAFSLAEH
ncbi:MAG: hypothetical protein WC655_17000 [Candidatus Hydrogenedentales bacterium]|jgi:hypothetical protein